MCQLDNEQYRTLSALTDAYVEKAMQQTVKTVTSDKNTSLQITGFPLTWKTLKLLESYTYSWYYKLIYAGFDTVTAVSYTS